MKEYWFAIVILLAFGVIAGFAGMMQTAAFASNLPPRWDSSTTRFSSSDGKVDLNLDATFFDPDGDLLVYGAQPDENATAALYGNVLHIETLSSGTVDVTASDGKAITTVEVTVVKQ